jgi:hypothetical protein
MVELCNPDADLCDSGGAGQYGKSYFGKIFLKQVVTSHPNLGDFKE